MGALLRAPWRSLHAFHARDGMGLVLARQHGIPTAAISGRNSKNVEARLSELKVPHIHQGISDKLTVLDELRTHYGLQWDEIAFVGDDVNDIILLEVGLAGCRRCSRYRWSRRFNFVCSGRPRCFT